MHICPTMCGDTCTCACACTCTYVSPPCTILVRGTFNLTVPSPLVQLPLACPRAARPPRPRSRSRCSDLESQHARCGEHPADPATLSRTHTQKRAARVGAAARRDADGEGVNFRFITCMNVKVAAHVHGACACYAIACAATRRQAQNSSGTPASAQVRCSGSGSRMDSAPASSEAVFGYAASWTIAW